MVQAQNDTAQQNWQEFAGEAPKTPQDEKSRPEAPTPPPTGRSPNGAPKAEVSQAIVARADGVLIGQTFEDQFRICRALCASGLVPKQFDRPEKVFVAFQFALSLGLKPILALRNIMVVNQNPALWGELPLAMVRDSGKLKSIREQILDKDGKEICPDNKNLDAQPWVSICTTVRKAHGEDPSTLTTWFTWDEAKKAGLLGKTQSIWLVYPRRMLQMRARGQNLKDHFPDVLAGAAIGEYDFNATVETTGRVIGPEGELSSGAQSAADVFNQAYGGGDEAKTNSEPASASGGAA